MPADDHGPEPYRRIVRECEQYLEKHGDSHLGVGWTRTPQHADVRHRVMLDVLRPGPRPVSLLDFGCGLSHLYEYMRREGIEGVEYTGLDLSSAMLDVSRRKFPDLPYLQLDVLEEGTRLPSFDYVIMNGILNLRADAPREAMWAYARRLISVLFGSARIGIAFNVMSSRVDWERDDLFHLPFDELAVFLADEVSRHFVVRHDYGQFEYSTYVYREPCPL